MHIFCVPQRVQAISVRVQVAKSCMRRAPKYGDVNNLAELMLCSDTWTLRLYARKAGGIGQLLKLSQQRT